MLSVVLAAGPLGAIEFGLFGDLTYVDSDAHDSPSSFVLGGVDFYVTQEISEHLTGFLELEFQGDEASFEADVERLWIRYQVRPAFRIAAGRFHTPIGFWNGHYHHGKLIQDTVNRPFFLDFEDGDTGMLPIHIVGLMSTGEVWAGMGELGYQVVVGNGQQLDSSAGLDPAEEEAPKLDPNNLEDLNDNKSVGGRLSLKSGERWQVGVFAITQKIAESGDPDAGALLPAGGTLVEQTVAGVDARYAGERFGMLGEYFDIHHAAGLLDGRPHDATAFYIQAWFDPTPRLRLTYRFSSLETDADDPFFRLLAIEEQEHDELTLTFRMDETSAIKAEVDLLGGSPVLEDTTTLRVQWAFLIP